MSGRKPSEFAVLFRVRFGKSVLKAVLKLVGCRVRLDSGIVKITMSPLTIFGGVIAEKKTKIMTRKRPPTDNTVSIFGNFHSYAFRKTRRSDIVKFSDYLNDYCENRRIRKFQSILFGRNQPFLSVDVFYR